MRIALPTTLALALAAAPAAQAAERLVVSGAGFGHGVGMSQYGTLGFAKKGKSYREILAHYYTGTALRPLGEQPTVRVLLQSGRSRVSFSGAVRAGSRALRPGTTYQATSYAGDRVVLRSPSGRKLATFAAPLVVAPAEGAAVRLAGPAGNGTSDGAYRGRLELRPSSLGGLSAVNAVGLEDYVRGVVSAESPSSWPAEALKAQAVAARTYAITTSKNGAGFDHYPDTRSQMYTGVAAEYPSTDAAVRATGGEVVTYRGEPVTTYFFSTSGGRTEDNENVWGGRPLPWLRSVEDPHDDVSPRHRWGPYRYTMRQAQAKLGGLVKGRFRSIKVVRRGSSPRVVAADVVGSRGRTRVSGATLRARFGLLDTWATFRVIGTKARPAPDPDSAAGSDPGSGGAQASAARAAGALVSGRISPARRGETVVVQRRTRAGWREEVRTHIGRGGRYNATVGRAGAYRVVFGGVTGPAVRVRPGT